MYRLEPNAVTEATNAAATIARNNRFTRVMEIWPGALYELRRPNGLDFRISIGQVSIGMESVGRWAYEVDVNIGSGSWQRVGKHAGTAKSPAEALHSAAESIALDEAPFGDTGL